MVRVARTNTGVRVHSQLLLSTHEEFLEELVSITNAKEAVAAVDDIIGFSLVINHRDVADFELQLLEYQKRSVL